MPSLSALTPWAVGQRITAATLNLAITEIAKLQALAKSDAYFQSKVGVVFTTGVQGNFGAWPTSGIYTGAATGVTVPAGIYLVTIRVNKTVGTLSTRVFVNLKVAASDVARQSIDGGVGEDRGSLTYLTDTLTAGSSIVPEFYQNSGANVTATAFMTIARLPIDV